MLYNERVFKNGKSLFGMRQELKFHVSFYNIQNIVELCTPKDKYSQ